MAESVPSTRVVLHVWDIDTVKSTGHALLRLLSKESLAPNTYVSSVSVNNTTNGAGSSSRVATLIVEPKDYKLTVSASPSADGTVAGGGEVPEGNSTTVTATPNSGFQFVQWTENGSQVSTSPSYMFMMPSRAITLVAHFQKS
jgi:Divergent InlB B-repeat domain